MKRFMLFAGDKYYPSGGMRDHRESSDSFEELRMLVHADYDWWHIYDAQENAICDQGTNGLYK